MSEEQQEKIVKGPGQILKEARQRADFSTQDIADKVRLKKQVIEDIELDNYDINVSLTFIRGYLKLYAKQVNVLEDEVLSAFDNINTKKKEPAKLQSFSRRIANQANDDKLMLVTYLVGAVVIALVVLWWLQQSSSESVSSSVLPVYQETLNKDLVAENPQTSIGVVDEVEPSVLEDEGRANTIGATTISVTVVDTGQTTTESSIPGLQNELAESDTSSVSQNESLIEETLLDDLSTTDIAENSESLTEQSQQVVSINLDAEPVELVFEFSGDCWMNLADATGENIAYGVKVEGRVMPVTGIPPFTVTLGAPEVVKISYGGNAVDMSFLTPGRIAKFDLPLTE